MKLDGEWVPVEAHLSGDALPEDLLQSFHLTISDTRYSVRTGGQEDTGSLKYYQFSIPLGLDFIGEDGPNKDRTIKAIYKYSGGYLFICYNLYSDTRPSNYLSTPENNYYLVRYRRATS